MKLPGKQGNKRHVRRLMQAMGERLAEHRVKADITQAELGDLIGCNRTSIYKMELGERKITVLEAILLCFHLGIDLEDLIPHRDDVIGGWSLRR